MQSNPSGGILIDGSAYPSVTKILTSDPKRKTFYKAQAVKRKKQAFDGVGRAVGMHRGTSLHETFANYITTGECDCAPIYYSYWQNLLDVVSRIDIDPIWAERPLLPEHSKFTDGETSVIWSKKHKFLGKPDLIGLFGGVPAVCEIKTSTDLFTKNYDRRNFATYSQWMPYSHSAMQVASYAAAWNERTGDNINTGIVINVTPETAQLFIIDAPEMQSRFTNFRKLCRDFHKLAR